MDLTKNDVASHVSVYILLLWFAVQEGFAFGVPVLLILVCIIQCKNSQNYH